ncbi:oxysterol-binding protein [Astrocystis sublimbata]|nr:oxysterol-binding protein [Astrocystis sublimbata]
MAQSSNLGAFFKFLASVSGDLANITAPSHFLASSSVTEVSNCWTERPALFAAPALESDPEKRSLLVLKWMLASLKSQFYVGGSTETSIKKPLNAFLGEVFTASWTDGSSTANILSEQVSHHPPITACCAWDKENGVRGEGYCRVEMTFNGHVNVRQIGHCLLHLDKYDEDYLIPLPDVQVKGFLSGRLYPEIKGTYHIVASTGYVSVITFSGTSLFGGGESNRFVAKMYHRDDPKQKAIYEVSGRWSDRFVIRDARTSVVVQEYDTNAPYHTPSPLTLPPTQDQDPWESRRAWGHVISSLKSSDFGASAAEKSKIENAQREMRADEAQRNTTWTPLFFAPLKGSFELFATLASAATGWSLQSEATKGVWKADMEKIQHLSRPFHKGVTPTGSVTL